MELAARTAAWRPSGTPLPYDAEVAWLEGDGASWIAIPLTGGVEFSYGVSFTENHEAIYRLTGTYTNILSQLVAGLINASGASPKLGLASSNKTYGLLKTNVESDKVYDVIVGSPNGVSVASGGIVLATDTATAKPNVDAGLLIFATRKNKTATDVNTICNSGMRLHYFALGEVGNRVFDAIPVRVGSEGCLYDRVSGTVFRNAGTGAFTFGLDRAANGVLQVGGGGV